MKLLHSRHSEYNDICNVSGGLILIVKAAIKSVSNSKERGSIGLQMFTLPHSSARTSLLRGMVCGRFLANPDVMSCTWPGKGPRPSESLN